MKVTAAAKVGFTAILVALVLIGIFRGMGWQIPGLSKVKKGVYNIYVGFPSVKGLILGADVQLNGNPIGEVSEITNDEFGGVLVALVITTDIPIHEQAQFTITRENIFGGYLVAIEEQRSGYMSSQVIDGSFRIRIETGIVDVGALVMKDGTAIGQITSVEPFDKYSDSVVVKLADPTVTLTNDMAFVPNHMISGALTGLTVYNKIAPDSILQGRREAGPEDLIADADTALKDLTFQMNIIMSNFSGLLESFNESLNPEDIRNLLNTLTTQINLIAGNVVALTNELNSMLAENRPLIAGTFENIEGLTSDARGLVQDFSAYNDPQLRENINSIVANLADATETLTAIMQDVEAYTSDEALRQDITGAVSDARATLETARTTLESAQSVINDATSTVEALSNIDTTAEIRLHNAPNPDRWQGDFNFWVDSGSTDVFLTAGIDDIGEENLFNAQLGWRMNDGFSVRGGLHHNKIGAGLDWRSDAYRVFSDVYDLNDLKWDVYAGYAIIPELDLIVGVEDLLEDNYLNAGIAFRF